jgi:hypothetical protein
VAIIEGERVYPLDSGPDLFGEKFKGPDNMLLGQISEESRDQLEAAETEFGVKGGDPLGHRIGTADDRHFPEPAVRYRAPLRSESVVVAGRRRDGIRRSASRRRASQPDGRHRRSRPPR